MFRFEFNELFPGVGLLQTPLVYISYAWGPTITFCFEHYFVVCVFWVKITKYPSHLIVLKLKSYCIFYGAVSLQTPMSKIRAPGGMRKPFGLSTIVCQVFCYFYPINTYNTNYVQIWVRWTVPRCGSVTNTIGLDILRMCAYNILLVRTLFRGMCFLD